MRTERILSPNFFLDTPGWIAKMNTWALPNFNAHVFFLLSPNLRLSHSDRDTNRASKSSWGAS